MDREAGPSGVEGNVRYRVSEEIVQVAIDDVGEAPEFACTKAYVRPRRRRRNIRVRRSRCKFGYCLLSFVVISLLYLLLKYYSIQANVEKTPPGPKKTVKTCPPLSKTTYDERKDIHSHTSFTHDGYCYYILQVDRDNFTNCIAEGFVLSHFIQRGNKIRKYLFDKVKQLGHYNKPIHIGAYIECCYCMADSIPYVCNGCIINEMIPKSIYTSHEYKCPQMPTNPKPWDGSSHGLQFEPQCIQTNPRQRRFIEPCDGPNYGIYLKGGQFKYIEERTNNSPYAWYLCEMKL